MKLQKLAADLRFLQLYAHNSHNLIKGETFFVDHEELGGIYPVYEAAYDAVVERAIGIGEEIDLVKVQEIAVATLKQAEKPESFKACFKSLLDYEKYICKKIQEMLSGYSEGTKQFLGGLADQSEMRQYKFKQRAS